MKRKYFLLVLLIMLSSCTNIEKSASFEDDIVIKSQQDFHKNKVEHLQNNSSNKEDGKTNSNSIKEEINEIYNNIEKDKDISTKEDSNIIDENAEESKKNSSKSKENLDEFSENMSKKTSQKKEFKSSQSQKKDDYNKIEIDESKSDISKDVVEISEDKGKDTSINQEEDKSNEDDYDPINKEEIIIKDNDEKNSEKLEPYSLYLNTSHVSYLDLGIDNYDIEKTQAYIDMGNIIATVTKFDPNDSEITYFAGHTYNFRGVNRLETGSIVTVTDSNGKGFKYKIIDWAKYPAGLVDNQAPFIGGYHLSQLAGDGIGVESIVVQYCDDQDIPMIFFGLPLQ